MRFWPKVDRSGGPEACWPWTGSKRSTGYGGFNFDGRNLKAHRVAFSLATGEDPAGRVVCHRCDNPPCCNPAHLFMADQRTNLSDMRRKRRASCGRGEGNGRARISSAQVTEIRRRYAAGGISYKALASEYGVAESTIGHAVEGRTWRHLGGIQ